MKISIDTKEDSHEEIKKVIKMLQNLVGAEEVFTNELSVEPSVSGQNNADNAEAAGSIFTNMIEGKETDSASESAEGLFAELFSEEELKKIDNGKDDEDEKEIKLKDKKYNIELY